MSIYWGETISSKETFWIPRNQRWKPFEWMWQSVWGTPWGWQLFPNISRDPVLQEEFFQDCNSTTIILKYCHYVWWSRKQDLLNHALFSQSSGVQFWCSWAYSNHDFLIFCDGISTLDGLLLLKPIHCKVYHLVCLYILCGAPELYWAAFVMFMPSVGA